MGLCESKIYITLNEIKKLRDNGYIILIANNKIYDVTTFVNEHPGSANAILRNHNNDCSQSYYFHSSRAKKIWDKFRIGHLKK
jgi:cytochrome b involved in lipid metabolism